MSNTNDIQVKIGEIKIGTMGQRLKATLGSCVGIVFVWKLKGVFGLAHCLLPELTETNNTIGAKYVNQAIPSLIKLLKIKEEDIKDIQVYIAGGGNMMSQLSRKNHDHIGVLNIMAAKKYLKEYGFKVKELEVGGDEGYQLTVDCSTNDISVKKLKKTA